MAIDWTPARLEVDLNYKSKDIVLASEWNNLWKETRLQGNNNTDGIVLLIEIVEGNVTHLTNLDNLFADLESKVTAHTGNSDIHVISEQKTAWTAKYDKPSGGIPKSDLASSVQASLDKADTALQQHQDISALTAHVANNNIHVTVDNKTAWNAKYDKPVDGIPKTDLSSGVQTSLNKADTALQEHQDISDLVSHTQNSNIHLTSEQKTEWSAKYDKPTGGIPKSDLASAVQASLNKADTALQEHQDISALTNHVANNDIHVTTTEKAAWNLKPELFNIYVSQNRGTGAYYADKTFDEILAAYNAGYILKISLSGSGGIFDSYLESGNRFTFYVPSSRSRVLITASTITVEYAPTYVPVVNTSDVGKVLTVDSSNTPVWAEATSSGSSGAEVFLVTFTKPQGASSSTALTADKTYAEIVAAHEAGKIVRCSSNFGVFGDLVSVDSDSAIFRTEVFMQAVPGFVLFSIFSSNKVGLQILSQYTPQFYQRIILASNWSSGVYSFEDDFSSGNYNIEIELDSTATEPQVEAWINAKVTAVFGTNKMKALGDVPTVDIPVIVKVV